MSPSVQISDPEQERCEAWRGRFYAESPFGDEAVRIRDHKALLLRGKWSAVFRHDVDIPIQSIVPACSTSESICLRTRCRERASRSFP